MRSNPQEKLRPTKWDDGSTTISNENRLDLFKNKIVNKKGGYIGVGTTQNFTLAAWARSEWIWLIDFTRIAVAANRLHIAFLKHSSSPDDFKRLWQLKSREEACQIIKTEYANDPELNYLLKTWSLASHFVRGRLYVLQHFYRTKRYSSWYTSQEMFLWAKSMAERDHIIALKGDLKGTTTFKGIAQKASEMGVDINVIYLSNAEEYFVFNKNFIKNMTSLPTGKEATLLRTMTIYKWIFPWAPGSDFRNLVGFHYNYMAMSDFKQWLQTSGKGRLLYDLVKESRVYGSSGLSQVLPIKQGELAKSNP
jgi:hypothetical protein